jgi:hypothetical protein
MPFKNVCESYYIYVFAGLTSSPQNYTTNDWFHSAFPRFFMPVLQFITMFLFYACKRRPHAIKTSVRLVINDTRKWLWIYLNGIHVQHLVLLSIQCVFAIIKLKIRNYERPKVFKAYLGFKHEIHSIEWDDNKLHCAFKPRVIIHCILFFLWNTVANILNCMSCILICYSLFKLRSIMRFLIESISCL